MAAPSRVAVVHGALVLFAVALVFRAGKVQVVEGEQWVERAKRQHFSASSLSAARGEILDANGKVLVESREMRRVAIALPEVRDTALVLRTLRRARLDITALRGAIARRRRWIDLPGVYSASSLASVSQLNGVHLTPVLRRVYSPSEGLRRIVGRLDPRGSPLDGIELALDTVLRGDSGKARLARDRDGRRLETPDAWTTQPRPGSTVVLTINSALQDICERALAVAVDSLGASGGDIVVMNPHTGEILAMASNRVGQTAFSNTAVTEPFEPGSTLKPFVAAALLSRDRAQPDDTVNTFNGRLQIDGRTISDMHKAARLSLADVIRFSSNVGIVQFGQRLTPREKYEMLRDLGFGMAAGVPLPAESPGILREPSQWSRQTSASVLLGYEIAVTPLQLVSAYSAIANGGELLEPQLVKEIRSPDGDVVYRLKPRSIRRVMPGAVARTVQQMLLSVVREGTATKADLKTFEVAGKSGTARRVSTGAGYTSGNYTASFVGLFPANDPQYVVLVKLDSPSGAHYAGGDIAAPVTRIVLRAALAARDAALDREDLVAAERLADNSAQPESGDSATAGVGAADSALPAVSARVKPAPAPAPKPYVVKLPAQIALPPASKSPRAVPDVSGLTLRGAVRAIHAAGFTVRLVVSDVAQTFPAAGTIAPAGSVVQLGYRR